MPKMVIQGDVSAETSTGSMEVDKKLGTTDTGADGVAAEFKVTADSASHGHVAMWLFDGFGGRIDFNASGLNYTLRLVPVAAGNEGDGGIVGTVQTYKISTATHANAKIVVRPAGNWSGDNHATARHEGASGDSYKALIKGNGSAELHIPTKVVA